MVLTVEQKAIVVAFRRHTLLPLDDGLDALPATIPGLTRSSLHRCLQRHGIHFTTPGAGGSAVPDIRAAMAAGDPFRAHSFELACAQCDIEHRLTKPRRPWTNGRGERMNRTIKQA